MELNISEQDTSREEMIDITPSINDEIMLGSIINNYDIPATPTEDDYIPSYTRLATSYNSPHTSIPDPSTQQMYTTLTYDDQQSYVSDVVETNNDQQKHYTPDVASPYGTEAMHTPSITSLYGFQHQPYHSYHCSYYYPYMKIQYPMKDYMFNLYQQPQTMYRLQNSIPCCMYFPSLLYNP